MYCYTESTHIQKICWWMEAVLMKLMEDDNLDEEIGDDENPKTELEDKDNEDDEETETKLEIVQRSNGPRKWIEGE